MTTVSLRNKLPLETPLRWPFRSVVNLQAMLCLVLAIVPAMVTGCTSRPRHVSGPQLERMYGASKMQSLDWYGYVGETNGAVYLLRRHLPLLGSKVREQIFFAETNSLPSETLREMRADRDKSQSAQCGNIMVAIGNAAWVWAGEHDDRLPSELHAMADELITPKMLICPADRFRQPAADWSSFKPAQSSYVIVTPNLHLSETNGVFLRCQIHGHLGYADDTVFDGQKRRRKIP